MTIIQAREEHVPLVSELFDLYRQYYRQASDLLGAKDYIHARITGDESVIFLAIDDDRGAAMGFVQLYPSFSSVSMKRLWVLNDLFVHPDFRRRGVGRELMERALQLGKDTDASALMLETEADNLPAQNLYENLGWKRSTDYFVYYRQV